jgi:hypothetical protein
MSIQYTYEIISVDESARCMEVVYKSDGRQTMHISTRIPFVNEPLEGVIIMYAPIAYWAERDAPVQKVQAGISGALEFDNPVMPTPEGLAYARRQAELSSSDWTQLPDVPLSTEKRAQWANYRHLLRDVPEQPGFPDNIVWPIPPDPPAPPEPPTKLPTSTL